MLLDAGGIVLCCLGVVCAAIATLCFVHGVREKTGPPYVLGLALTGFVILLSAIVFSWRPTDNRHHQEALRELAAQGIKANIHVKSNWATVKAGTCSFTAGLHQLHGVWHLTLKKSVQNPTGGAAYINTPINRRFIDKVASQPACR